MNQLTKITLCWELFCEGIPKSHIATRLCVHRETVGLWLVGISSLGLPVFLDSYNKAKKGERTKRKLDGLLKQRVLRLREENRNCCGQKIQKYLWNEYQIRLSVESIYKILRTEYKLRSKWKKNHLRGPVPKADRPREVVQMDTVDFGEIFAFTGIDIFVKDASVKLYPSLTSLEGTSFLDYSFQTRFKHANLAQVDGGPEFKDEFKKKIYIYADQLRVARPYKKNEQAYIESFNRSLRKECLGWGKYKKGEIILLQKEVDSWLDWWHTKRIHLAHMKTPNQILQEYKVSDI